LAHRSLTKLQKSGFDFAVSEGYNYFHSKEEKIMKKWKRFAGAALASVLAFTMAGCGADDAGSSNSGSKDTFKIGGIGPTTGDAAAYGQGVMNAIQMAVDEINAAGGVNGYQLELNFQDDENNAEKAVNAYNSLKDWNMQVLLGCVTSQPCIAVAEKTNEDNIFQLTPSGTAVDCTKYDNAFRICFSDPAQGTMSARYIGENNLGTKVAVIYDSSGVYSSGIYENFAKEAANQPFEIVSAEAFTSESNKDFSVQLQKAKDAGAEVLFLPIYYAEASLILTQADSMGFDPIFFGVDGMDGILSGVDNFDTSLAEGVMLLTPFAADATDDMTVHFVTTYQEKFGGTPNQFAADAYDCVYALKAGLEKCGATPSDSASDICEALKGAFVEISIDGLTGAGITWTADGEPNKEPKAVIIKDGAYTAM